MAAKKLNLPPDQLRLVEESATGSFLYSLVMLANVTSGMSEDYMSLGSRLAFAEADVIKDLSFSSCVIVGRGACALLKDKANVLRVFINSDKQKRLERAISQYGVDPTLAESTLQRQDKRRSFYIKETTQTVWKDPAIYHLFLNSGQLGITRCVEVLYAACGYTIT